ncbi:MAG: hypothetical protein C5B55_14245 [Blastocatellia bacterium]|nr:MAG: hypothetical protein C5B55_14245 [Blastocatellia bacterium]
MKCKRLNIVCVVVWVLWAGLFAVAANAQPVKAQPDDTVTGKPSAPATRTRITTFGPASDPTTVLRSARSIFVRSNSLLVKGAVVEDKLQKRKEFALLNLSVTRDLNSADVILELRHDLFTMYVYTAVDRRSGLVVATGKLSSLGGTVAGKVAERFLKQVVKARTGS